MKLLLTFVFALAMTIAYSQGHVQQSGVFVAPNGDVYMSSSRLGWKKFPQENTKSELYEDYKKADLIFTAKYAKTFPKTKYNFETGQLEVLDGDRKRYYDVDILQGFVIYNRDSVANVFLSVHDEKHVKPVFMELLLSGKVSLLSRKTVEWKKGNRNAALNTGTPDSFQVIDNFYVLNADNKATKVNLNKKTVLALTADKAEQMQKYCDESKIKLNTADGVVQALQYYNQLSESNQ